MIYITTVNVANKAHALFIAHPLFSADLWKFLLRSTKSFAIITYELFVSDLLESFLVLIQFCN